MNRFCYLFCLLVTLPLTCGADEEVPLLTPIEIAERIGGTEIVEYACARNTKCHVRCRTDPDGEPFDYDDVRRVEVTMGIAHWLVVATWVDSVGKGHRSSALLTVPVSCVMDDLVAERIASIVDGEIFRPSGDDDVIFEVQPQ